MTMTTRLFTFFNGKFVGKDEFGNRYFVEKRAQKSGRKKRWVLYNGKSEPSKIPPQWFGWMHYTTDILPADAGRIPHAWEKAHLPNLTGTKNAYHPPAPQSTADYSAWKPE